MKSLTSLIFLIFIVSCGNPVEIAHNNPIELGNSFKVEQIENLPSIVTLVENDDESFKMLSVTLFSLNHDMSIGLIKINSKSNLKALDDELFFNRKITIDSRSSNNKFSNLKRDNCYVNCTLHGDYLMFVSMKVDRYSRLTLQVILKDRYGYEVINRLFDEV